MPYDIQDEMYERAVTLGAALLTAAGVMAAVFACVV